MRWDDLEILRVMNRLEQEEQSSLSTGLLLMEAIRPRKEIDWNRDDREFARELILAHSKGLISWKDQNARNITPTDQVSQPHAWLQTIFTLRLTLDGRDRALGRVVEQPWPDPDEDDGRPITGMTLEEIARDLADTYTPAQMPRYLADSGIPNDALAGDPEKRWAYVLAVFERLLEGGSQARRVLRQFIGGWLEGRYHVGPLPEARRRIVALLGQQGWHIRDGRLVVGDRAFDSAGVLTPNGRDARVATLHPRVRQVAKRYLDSGLLDAAIFEAVKMVNARIRELSGLDLDGAPLMTQALSEQSPAVTVTDLSTETGRNVQAGYRHFFIGVARAFRNPGAHEPFEDITMEVALERLAFLSMLMRKLDDAHGRAGTEAP